MNRDQVKNVNAAHEAKKAYFREYKRNMSEEQKEKQRAYQRKWRVENREKVKKYDEDYWAKKAREGGEI